ncbi:MAG: serine/threonine protein kinase, partial [Planctomycetes bacterium]|nr:serine/threonine protein kinase [Planctomycetota bacterium]
MIDTRVRALLEACYEAIAAGDEPDLERLCADAPELRGTVERLLQREREFVAESRRPPEPAGDGPGLPQRIAEFTILDALGSGGMSRVYRARQEPFGREVALKVLRDEFVASGTGRLRFQREATITAALDHPHIVPVYAAGEADGHVYLAMKLLRGQSLERQPLPLPPADVARIGEQIASALAAAHEIGVVHRDVKPANIVLENDSAVVVDFGLSSFAHGAGTVTRPDSTPGTLIYLAPELVARRSRGLDPRVDVYGLGATLYEALAGHPPIPDGSPIRVLHAILHQEPAPLHLRGRLRDLETIVLRALDKSPQRRFQTAGEMAEELARHRAGLPIRSRPIAWHQRVWRLCRRHPTTALLSSVAAALLLTVALLLWLGARERERRFQRSLSGLATAIAEGDLARATRDLTAAGAACGARPELEALAGELADERRLQVLIALLQGPTAHKDRRALARLGGELGATAAARSPRADAALAIASRLVVDDPVSHRPLARATQLALPRTTAAMQAWSRGADVAVALAALPTTAATAVDHLFAALVLRIAHRGPAHVEAELRRAELRGPTADAVRYSLAVALEAQQAHRGAL